MTAFAARLTIRDPEPEVPPLEVEEDEIDLAVETLARGKIARGLMLAGAPNLSRIVAAPYGDDPANLPDTALPDREVGREGRLREEGLNDVERLTSSDGFLGREATLELPFRIETPSGSFTRAFVRSEVAKEVVKFWEEDVRGSVRGQDRLASDQEGLARGKISTQSDASGGELRDGKLFRSRIEFRK